MSTGETMGANIPQLVRNGEVWRLITAAFLHVNFLHYFGNVLATLILTSKVEYTLGWWKLLILVIISGIGGNVFGALASFNTSKMGASTSLFGSLGFCIGYIILNWRGIRTLGSAVTYQICYTAGIFFVFGVISTLAPNVDFFGHLGGFLVGIWSAWMLKPFLYEKREKIMRFVFLGILIFQFVLTIALLFGIHDYKRYVG